MVSIENVIRNMKEILGDLSEGNVTDVTQIEYLANSYEDAFIIMAEKANRCLELLHEGSLEEAQKLARQEPDLRNQLKLLDIDERLQWIEQCENLGINCDNITSVNINSCLAITSRIYKSKDQLNELLKIYRRLALSRASLGQRLKVLRAIYREDSTNGVWAEDIRDYEKAYLDEISKRSKKAADERDLDVLEQILAEINSKEWFTRIPRSFVNAVEKVVLKNRKIFTETQFKEIADKVHKAHGMMDESGCRKLLDQWNSIIYKYGISPSEELAGKILPAETWIDNLRSEREKEEMFEIACHKLEEAIDENKPIDILQRLAAEVLHFESGMPELLAARFNSRIQALRLKSKRKFSLIITGMSCCLILIIIVIVLTYIEHNRNQIVHKWKQQIAMTLNNDDLDGAGKLLDKIEQDESEIAQSPEIIGLKNQYKKKLMADDRRKKRLGDILESYSGRINEAMLKEAEGLAKSSEEMKSVNDWRQKYERHLLEQLQKREEEFEERIENLEGQCREFSSSDSTDLTTYLSRGDELLSNVEDLKEIGSVSEGLLARSRILRDTINKAINSARDKKEKMLQKAKHIERLGEKYKSLTELEEDLKSFIESYNDDKLSIEFKRTLISSSHWESIDKGNNLFMLWQSDVNCGNIDSIKAFLDQIDNYNKNYLNSPYRDRIEGCQKYLEDSLKVLQKGDFSSNLSDFEEFLNLPIIREAFVIKDDDDKQYYMFDNTFSEFQSDKYVFSYIVNSSLETKRIFISGKKISPDDIRLSTQAAFAKKASDLIAEYKNDGDEWNTLFLRLALLCCNHDDMDPILCLNVVRKLLEYSKESMPYEEDGINRIFISFNKIDIDVPWMNPESQKAAKVRGVAWRLKDKIANDTKSLLGKINKRKMDIEKSLIGFTFVGVIFSDDGIKLYDSYKNGSLFVFESEFKELGKISNYKPVVNRTMLSRYPQGTPVFVLLEPSPQI